MSAVEAGVKDAVQSAVEELRTLLGERLSTARAVREQHGHDEAWHAPRLPDAVAYPLSASEVVEIVRVVARHGVPIVPFGAGTSLEGHVIPIHGGISLDCTRMNRVLAVHADDLDVVVEPGVTRKQLNEHLRDTGLFFPIDPGADASIGGMAATRASGTNAVRYGTMRENVLALEVVLPDGRKIRTARRARKSSAGYDLTRLFVGSEGTLGVITEITLRVYGVPEAIAAASCPFANLDGAVATVIATIQSGIPIARIELLDDTQIDAINRYSKMNHPVHDTLLLEFHGSPAGVKEQAEAVQALAREHGGGEFRWTTREDERRKLWQARHDAAYANKALRPGCEIWATDVCMPISRLAQCIAETKADLKQSFLLAPIVGHVGDGNFHVTFVIDRNKPEEMAEAERLNERMVHRALALDGTCTGEHGVGIGKMAYLADELGEGVALMRQIKRAIDPGNLMNPGKIVTF